MAANDGSRLNLASQLAATAAELQKTLSNRRGRSSDPALVDALADVESAVGHLSAAVVKLATPVAEEADGDA